MGFLVFGVPKKDKKQVRTVGDFRALNAMLERTQYCVEPTHELLCSIEHFTWTSNLD